MGNFLAKQAENICQRDPSEGYGQVEPVLSFRDGQTECGPALFRTQTDLYPTPGTGQDGEGVVSHPVQCAALQGDRDLHPQEPR